MGSYEAGCPFNLSEVLLQCGLKSDAVPVQAVCWRRMSDDRPLVVESVVLVVKDETDYALVAAWRHPEARNPYFYRWSLFERSDLYEDCEPPEGGSGRQHGTMQWTSYRWPQIMSFARD